jgi:phosphoglycerol transferase MdoB-like AlkP superfamily enzyme
VGADVNEWGVNDDVLFDQVAENILDEPTFNLIISTTYHPPYDLDVEALGFPVTSPPVDLADPCTNCTPDFLHTVGHAWFADCELGDFVEQVSAEHPDALFVITTDHWSRRFINDRPPLWAQVEAPFILYGPTVLEGFDPSPFFGSHLDIAPTLIELLSPKGHEYNTFGRDMFAQSDEQYSEGADVVLGQGFMARHDGSEVERWAGAGDIDPAAVEAALLWSKKLKGLAWWRIMRGNQLPVGDGALTSVE